MGCNLCHFHIFPVPRGLGKEWLVKLDGSNFEQINLMDPTFAGNILYCLYELG